ISSRIKTLIKDMTRSVYGKHKHDRCRYILEAEDVHYVLEFTDGKFQHRDSLSNMDLYRYLSQPIEKFSPVIFDRNNRWKTCLPLIYQLNRQSIIQIFYLVNGHMVDIYILDEQGSLFRQTLPFYNESALIHHYNLFFTSILNRKRFITGDMISIENIDTEYYSVSKAKTGKFSITRVNGESLEPVSTYTEIKVIGSLDKDENSSLNIYCDDLEFSTLDSGQDVFTTVASYIMSKRKAGKPYPIYITDIDFSTGILNVIAPEHLQTIHFLNYKKHIEGKLNQEMQKVSH
ncbi:MAG: class I adenylate cyclase, partial [Thiotrichales bacterium]|nr:class I adenylate cyclase [Thiotrichales bacterium]